VNAGSIVLLGSGPAPTAGGGLGPSWPPVPREPLPPYPAPVDYKTVLPFTPPTGRARDFYRGQFCGLRVAGAPTVPGSNGANPECIMACLLDNYPPAIQHQFLSQYAEAGYTHLQRSLGHALGYGHSIDAFLALTRTAQREYGLFADVWLIANEFPGFVHDADAAYWGPILDPYLARLVDAGAIDLCCPSWQMDQVMSGAPGNATISILAHVAKQLPPSIPLYSHWVNEALAWWKKVGTNPDGSDIGEIWSDEYQTIEVHDRFSWWYAMRYYLTGGHHQGNTRMLMKEYQDRLCDTLDYFGDERGRDTGKGDMGQSLRSGTPTPFALTVFECSAQDQFDDTPGNPYAIDELEGDQRGYVLMCTTSPWGHMRGYGNGARRPAGSAL
jgi:hypothetical protein